MIDPQIGRIVQAQQERVGSQADKVNGATHERRRTPRLVRRALWLVAVVALLLSGFVALNAVRAGSPSDEAPAPGAPVRQLAPTAPAPLRVGVPLVFGEGAVPPRPLATRERFGVAFLATGGALSDYPLDRLPFGWYTDWWYRQSPERPGGREYAQVLPVDPERFPPDWAAVRAAILANPGALWMIGNEPECIYQGHRTPEEYAEIYHEYYVLLKGLDPTCQVAIGGVVQPTPLRLAWLDRVLAHYAARYGCKMPVDVWNIHNMILQEKRNDYGCDIPVGLEANEGVLYPWWENDSLTHFADQIRAFRAWMAQRGERRKPLIVSEYGILYASAWFDGLGGLSGDERVKGFMEATFDYMLHATDPEIGCTYDGNRLVQRWVWLSLNAPTFAQDPVDGYNGNLCDADTRALTPFGEHYERLLQRFLAED